jgi:hypothetical protein
MADTPKGAEGAEEVGFDTEKALNKKGFAEFLAKHDDAEKGEVTQGDMESRFEIFGIQTEVAKDVQEVYKNEIFRDIGIRLDAADLACVSEFIEKRAVEAPGEVLAMQEQLKQFKELPEKIKQANNEILELAKTGEGFWGKTKMVGEYFWEGEAGKTYSAREKVEKTGVPLTREAIDVRIKWLATQVESSVKDFKSGNWVEGNEDLVTQFAKVKKSLFSHGQLREDMNRIAQEKLKAQLDILVNKGDLKSAEAGFKRMSGVKNDVETGLDYMTDGTEEEVKVALNHTSESYVYNKIENILTSMSLGSNAFANLERTYKQAVNTETVGDKDKSESIQFIIDTIESQVSALLETPANKTEIRAKKILARQLAAKLSKNK